MKIIAVIIIAGISAAHAENWNERKAHYHEMRTSGALAAKADIVAKYGLHTGTDAINGEPDSTFINEQATLEKVKEWAAGLPDKAQSKAYLDAVQSLREANAASLREATTHEVRNKLFLPAPAAPAKPELP